MRTFRNNKGWLHSHLYAFDQEEKDIGTVTEKEHLILQIILFKTKVINFYGPENCGKTAINDIILQNQKSITFLDGTEINSVEDLKIALRSTQKVSLRQETTVIEGEIININSNSITLKTDEMESVFTIREQAFYEEGDIVQIIDGNIQKIGSSKLKENIDVETKIVAMPKGKLLQKRTISKEMTVLDLDRSNTGTTPIDLKLTDWIDRNKAKLIDSALVIDNADILSSSILNFIASVEYLSHVPCIILISNDKLHLKNSFKIKTDRKNETITTKVLNKRFFFENITSNIELQSKLEHLSRKKGLKFAMNYFFLLSTHSHLEQKNLSVKDFDFFGSIYKNIDEIE